jgi:hypothetical protein
MSKKAKTPVSFTPPAATSTHHAVISGEMVYVKKRSYYVVSFHSNKGCGTITATVKDRKSMAESEGYVRAIQKLLQHPEVAEYYGEHAIRHGLKIDYVWTMPDNPHRYWFALR